MIVEKKLKGKSFVAQNTKNDFYLSDAYSDNLRFIFALFQNSSAQGGLKQVEPIRLGRTYPPWADRSNLSLNYIFAAQMFDKNRF